MNTLWAFQDDTCADDTAPKYPNIIDALENCEDRAWPILACYETQADGYARLQWTINPNSVIQPLLLNAAQTVIAKEEAAGRSVDHRLVSLVTKTIRRYETGQMVGSHRLIDAAWDVIEMNEQDNEEFDEVGEALAGVIGYVTTVYNSVPILMLAHDDDKGAAHRAVEVAVLAAHESNEEYQLQNENWN